MLILLFVLIIIVFVVLTVIVLSRPQGGSTTTFTYDKNFSLLSSTEKAFLRTLEPLLDETFRIFVKVRLADLIQVRHQAEQGADRQTLARINATTIDFVICNAEDLSIVGAIDLADGSFSETDTTLSDALIDKAAAAAQLPLVRLPARLQYQAEEIADLLTTSLKLPEHTGSKPAISEYGSCPTCGEPLMLLKAKHGENIGKYFLGCSNSPECKYLSPLNEGSTAETI